MTNLALVTSMMAIALLLSLDVEARPLLYLMLSNVGIAGVIIAAFIIRSRQKR